MISPTKKVEPLTTDTAYDEENAAWSPDGTQIAIVSNQDKDWDRTENTDVFVVDAKPNQHPRRLTTYPGRDGGPLSWSPDSKLIAYTQGSDPKFHAITESVSSGARRQRPPTSSHEHTRSRHQHASVY